MDYTTLLLVLPPDPDLYFGGSTEFLYYTNLTVSPSALFVSRTDAGGGYDDDNPSVFFLPSVEQPASITVPPVPQLTPSQSAYAACLVGWPATYACPQGYLWVVSIFLCMPCSPGYFMPQQVCVPCPVGSYSPQEASTSCLSCAYARAAGMSQCSQGGPSGALAPSSCLAGYEIRLSSSSACAPCLPGFAKSGKGVICSPCAPGLYSDALGRTSCSPCQVPFVSTQWASSGCLPCPVGYVPQANRAGCQGCLPNLQYFVNIRPVPFCANKTVLSCSKGFYLSDGGGFADNLCIPCLPCPAGQLMVPFLLDPCPSTTSALNAPYKCVPYTHMPGQFASVALSDTNSSAFTLQYTPCQGLPSFAAWTQGPHPSVCFFACNYAISGPASTQYLFYYSILKVDPLSQFVLQQILGHLPNVYPLDYPGLNNDLMVMSSQVCMPCPNTPCPWGFWRPILSSNGCGPPICQIAGQCQVMPAGPVVYAQDGCSMPCTIPNNSHIIGASPIGLGDACPWQCNFGFYMQPIVLNEGEDGNQTDILCLPCEPSACARGTQNFQLSLCLPQSTVADFCLPCPLNTDLAVLVSQEQIPGQCAYACLPNISYASSITGQCVPCPSTANLCPTGFRQACAESPCAPCPPLPMSLWISAVPMPSRSSTCQAACRDGYHTLDSTTLQILPPAVSYDASTIRCASCSLQPAVPCPSRTCPVGYFSQVPGSGLCIPCATVYDCALGFFPSSCVCTLCPVFPYPRMPILQAQADALAQVIGSQEVAQTTIVQGWGACPTVCPANTAGPACQPCGPALYALWNASNSSHPNVRRAGLCWPCPAGFVTLPGDPDLCMTPKTPQDQMLLAPLLPNPALLLGSLPQVLMLSRKLLGLPSSSSATQILCPAFASPTTGQGCRCNRGFRASSSGCALQSGALGNHKPLPQVHRLPSLRLPPLPLACGPGLQAPLCTPCPRGTYSAYMGFAPCMPCPDESMTTMQEGSISATQCVVPRAADTAFVSWGLGSG